MWTGGREMKIYEKKSFNLPSMFYSLKVWMCGQDFVFLIHFVFPFPVHLLQHSAAR